MVLKKNKVENSTLFIDASKECVKITNNNKLTEENIQNIFVAREEKLRAEIDKIITEIEVDEK